MENESLGEKDAPSEATIQGQMELLHKGVRIIVLRALMAEDITIDDNLEVAMSEWDDYCKRHLSSVGGKTEDASSSKKLTAEQERIINSWAADDRLWTTQGVVAKNLRKAIMFIIAGRRDSGTEKGVREMKSSPATSTVQGLMKRSELLNQISKRWAWKCCQSETPLYSWIERGNGDCFVEMPTSVAENVCREQSASIVRAVDSALSSVGGKTEDASSSKTTVEELSAVMCREIIKRREEIIEAFIAKYGCDPSEIIQCATQDYKWFVRRMTPEEIAFRDKVQKLAQPASTPESAAKVEEIAAAETRRLCFHLNGIRFETNCDEDKVYYAIRTAITEAIAHLPCPKCAEKDEELHEQAGVILQGCCAVQRLRDVIGRPPKGSEPGEENPRGKTWHEERRNWKEEAENLRARLAEADTKRLDWWIAHRGYDLLVFGGHGCELRSSDGGLVAEGNTPRQTFDAAMEIPIVR